MTAADPHADCPLLTAGPMAEEAAATVLLVHGRGANAEGMLSFFERLDLPNVAAIAPQAAGHTWYPLSFLAPMRQNQPFLASALQRVGTIVEDLLARGVAADRIALLGFSQGACLSLEFAARTPRRYGGVIGLLGGLIGPPGTPRQYAGSFDGTAVFLGCSDPDPHIPFARVQETAQVLQAMGAAVGVRRYPDEPHAINADMMDVTQAMLRKLATQR